MFHERKVGAINEERDGAWAFQVVLFVFLVPHGGSHFSVSGIDFFSGSEWHLKSSRQVDETRWRPHSPFLLLPRMFIRTLLTTTTRPRPL